MNRREFLGAVAAVVTIAPAPVEAAPAAGIVPRPLYRLESGRWVRRRMRELVPGDIFRLCNPDCAKPWEIFRADSPPHELQNGNWEINATSRASTKADP